MNDMHCTWTHDGSSECDLWETDCGQETSFDDGGPSENGYKFCPWCGRPLVVKVESEA